MKYVLLIYGDEGAWTEPERERCVRQSAEYAHELHRQGKYLGASPLQPAATATTLRLQDGRRMVLDGPFTEAREQLGGYFLIEANDLDEAIAIAERLPSAPKSLVEIRPLVDVTGLLPQLEHEIASETAVVNR